MASIAAAQRAERERLEKVIWRAPVGNDATHFIVCWNIRDAEISLPRLRELLEDCGLADLATPPVRQTSSVIRALHEMAEHEHAEEILNDDEEIAYSLIRFVNGKKAGRGQVQARTAQRMTVSVLKRPQPGEEAIIYGSAQERAVIEPLLRRYREAYIARDITTHILSAAVYRAGGIKMAEQGGFYFVPASGSVTMERLRAFVGMLATETGNPAHHISTIAVTDSGTTREDMRFHAHRALIAELRTQQAHLRDLLRPERTDEETGATLVKPATAEGYMFECRVTLERAALYYDTMKLGLRDLKAAAGAITDALDAVRSGATLSSFDTLARSVETAIQAAEQAGPHEADEADDDDVYAVFDAAPSAADGAQEQAATPRCPNGHPLRERGIVCPLCGAQYNVVIPAPTPATGPTPATASTAPTAAASDAYADFDAAEDEED